MNNVEQGGATIFPELQHAVFPLKGTALLFHNVDSRGNCMRSTVHGSCPVIVGTKWGLSESSILLS